MVYHSEASYGDKTPSQTLKPSSLSESSDSTGGVGNSCEETGGKREM